MHLSGRESKTSRTVEGYSFLRIITYSFPHVSSSVHFLLWSLANQFLIFAKNIILCRNSQLLVLEARLMVPFLSLITYTSRGWSQLLQLSPLQMALGYTYA